MVCQVFYTYNVQVCLSGVTVAYLYQELGSAIRLQQVPTKFWPLTWTRSTIVSGYNAHPEFNDLYDFQAAVSHGSLNHGRRVLLSILYLLADTSRVGANTWKAAYYCLLFEGGERLLDCPGCNVNHPRIRNSELVREEITSQAMVALLLENYSEEEQEAKVSGLLLPVRLSAGVQCRDVRVSNIDACLGAMLQDERSPLGQRALSQRVLVEGPLAGGDQLVRYPFLRSSLAATGEVPVSDDTPLRAFTWLFAIKNVFVLMEGTLVDPGVTWRWYLFPLKRDIRPTPHVGQVDLSRVGSSSVSAADLVQGMRDVDLDMIAGSSFAVQGSRDFIGTLQSMFQKRTRCEGLNDPVPSSATRFVVGLEKILCWGALPLVVRGDSVVLPFASEDGAKGIIRWLETGTGVFTWAFLYSSISLGLLRVESINNYSYVCTF